MKRFRTGILLAGAFLAFATPVLAQGWYSGSDGQAFQEWLTKHPNVSNNLRANPYQIYDPTFRGQHPELQDYIQSHPGVWNNLKSQGSGYYDEHFNTFLAKHPHSAAELRANPDLIYDPRFRKQHPELNDYMASHPNVWRSVKSEYANNIRPAPIPNQLGAYDTGHHWRDAEWWHEHDREWFYKNHPEWVENHPEWRDHDGDYDEHHEWHDRYWWEQNHRDWVEAHHPHWVDKHEAHNEWKAQKDAEKNASKEAKAESKHHHGHGHDSDNDEGHGHGHD